MQKQLHPYLKTVTVITTDGSTYETRMLVNKNQLKLDLDPRSHAIWNQGTRQSNLEAKGQIAKFKRRFVQKSIS